MQHNPMKRTNNEHITAQAANNLAGGITKEETFETNTISQKRNRPPFWVDIVVILFIFFFSQFAGSLISNSLGLAPTSTIAGEATQTGEPGDDFTTLQTRYIACTYFFAMILSIIALSLYRKLRGWGKILSFKAPGWASPFRLLTAYILMWCFSITLEPFAEMLGSAPELMQQGGWLLISAIFIAPIFEEIVFRGYIAGTLRKSYGTIAAWIVSSILFGLAHGIPSTILTATFSGLILCYCYLRHRSLVISIILHAMNNATACFLMSLGMSDTTTREVIANDQVYWAVYALCLSISIIAIARMWQEIKSLESNKYIH